MAPSPHRTRTHAWYALRRTLPTWSFEKNLRELVRWLPRYRVDEVIVKVDTEEFTHGQPPLPWVRRYQKNLFRIRDAMRRLGILYSINPWITTGHCDRGRDSRRDVPGLQTVVGHDGSQATCCACPLSDAWRRHVAKVWTLYAETQPHVIWIEDDIRTFNHRPVDFGCFCPTHMRLFSERIGRPVTREQLVSAILRPGRPHPWRKAFLDVQAETMIDTVSFLAKVVHRASPDTCIGLMSSGPRAHCLEGRRWKAFAEALADGRPLYSRPPMGNYNEDSLRGFYYSHDSIKITRLCLPSGTIEQTEVENVPFTPYSKSEVFTFLEMAVSFAYGSHGVTMNLYDHAGTPMEIEPGMGRMLRDRKPFLNALAERAQQPGVYRGVRLLYHEKASYNARLQPGARFGDLADNGAIAMYVLEAHGIPTTFEDSNAVAVSGQTLRAFSDEEIRALLSRGILLDATAATCLADRGFGRAIGLRSIREPAHLDRLGTFSAEEFFNPRFGGAEKNFLTLTLPHLGGRPHVSRLETLPGAEIVSCLVDPDARRHFPAMVAFQNEWGGRVVIHAMDWASAYGPAFHHPFRAAQLAGALRWVTRNRAPMLVRGGVYPLALRKDIGTRTLLGLFNLSLDPWPFVEFDLADARRARRIERLTPSGRWVRAPAVTVRYAGGRVAVRCADAVAFDAPLFLTVEWA
jgi:hypothetical protein